MSSLPVNQQSAVTSVDFDPFAEGELLLTAPATESQKEIWASVQLGSDANCAYNESVSLRLTGELDTEALRSTFQAITARHEALRTTLSPDGNHLCIAGSLEIDVSLIDLSALNETDKHEKVAYAQHRAVSTAFDLEHGPLFRIELFRLQPKEHLAILTAHHIILDGWSWGVLIPELGKLYSALRRGETPDLETPDRFSDYALMLEEAEGSEDAIAVEKYWIEQFANSVPVVDFPTDRPRPPLRTFDSARIDWDLSPALVAGLKQLGNQFGCSFMTTLLSSFEVFLHRLTGQDDLVVGISAAGQADTGLYNLVGHCVNLLPLRTQIDANRSFSDYLRSRKSTVLDAYDRQQITFGSLVKQLSLPRDPSRIPLVPIVFNIDRGLDANALEFDGLTVELSSNPRSFENFELFINATELRDAVTLECQYNTNLFDADTIRRRLAEFETLLTGIVAEPNRSIATLPLLPESELQLLADWNRTQTTYPHNTCIHSLFEVWAERQPDAIALVFQSQSLTYGELNRRANQLAHHLQSVGVGPDKLVGICVERSLELVIGILGILKAGGAYVPLDPTYPPERLAFTLEDASVSVLLTQAALVENLPQQTHVVCLDSDWNEISQQRESNLATPVTPDNLAYVIYTSGSTGKPKGVLVNHANVVRLFGATNEWFHFNKDDVWTLFHSYAFDFSVWELWGALIHGGRVVMVPYLTSREPEAFYTLLVQENVTVLNQTPSAFRQLIKVEDVRGVSTDLKLRLVIFGGEALELQSLRPWFERHGDRSPQLVNMYGITETTVHVTYRPLTITDLSTHASVIGRPIPDLQVHLLDQQRQPVPIGIPGELYVGGNGLARGYLNRPELTQERFIANPFGDESDSRLYKTGDLARYLPNGDLEFLGRIDHQVKLRGFRIELGEIEAALTQHPSVREAIVMVREDVPGDQRLVGYSVLHPGQALTTSDLHHFLKQKLPDFMVPAAFVLLEVLPLTANGKVDRNALPQPDSSRPDLDQRYVAPRNAIEQQIAEIWQQVLQLKQIGIDDNFFELGGYSLLAIQVIARARQVLAVDLPLRTFFERPTIAGLSKQIEMIRWAVQAAQIKTQPADDYEEGEL